MSDHTHLPDCPQCTVTSLEKKIANERWQALADEGSERQVVGARRLYIVRRYGELQDESAL